MTFSSVAYIVGVVIAEVLGGVGCGGADDHFATPTKLYLSFYLYTNCVIVGRDDSLYT